MKIRLDTSTLLFVDTCIYERMGKYTNTYTFILTQRFWFGFDGRSKGAVSWKKIINNIQYVSYQIYFTNIQIFEIINMHYKHTVLLGELFFPKKACHTHYTVI